jgi:hypothetical protein
MWNVSGDVHERWQAPFHIASIPGPPFTFHPKLWFTSLIDRIVLPGTSKILDANSNYTPSTFGFRGEGNAASILCKLALTNSANLSFGFGR